MRNGNGAAAAWTQGLVSRGELADIHQQVALVTDGTGFQVIRRCQTLNSSIAMGEQRYSTPQGRRMPEAVTRRTVKQYRMGQSMPCWLTPCCVGQHGEARTAPWHDGAGHDAQLQVQWQPCRSNRCGITVATLQGLTCIFI